MILDLLYWGLKLGVVTTGLIGLVLLLRRPLAYLGGVEAVYLIWALPFLRLFMPNITLRPESGDAPPPWALWPDYFNWPGDGAAQGGLSVDEEIDLLMADEDIDIETRQAKAVGMKARDMISKFHAENPNPTWQDSYDQCVYEKNTLFPIYRSDTDTPAAQQEIAQSCEDFITRTRGARPE